MATFACVVLFVGLTLVAAENLSTDSDDTLSTTFDPLDLEGPQEKSLAHVGHKSNRSKVTSSQNKVKPGAESGVNPYFKLLTDKESARRKSTTIRGINDFWQQRNAVADAEVAQLFGHNMPFDERETKANKIILAMKYQEYEREVFPPSLHFYQAQSLIEESNLFKIIRKVPKGANLYSMLITSAGSDFMYQLTFDNNLYFRFQDGLKLKFSKERPAAGWRSLSYLRSSENAEYVEDLNVAVRQSLIFTPSSTTKAYSEERSDHSKILALLDTYNSLTTYKPTFIKTFKKVLELFYLDNIMYAELSYHFPDLYDLDGKTYKPAAVLQLCRTLVADFKKIRKDFVGVRFIYAPFRSVQPSYFRKILISLWETSPDSLAGFGLMQVDGNNGALSAYVEELLKFPKEVKFFFNAGLTKSWGYDSDYNLLDALTLNPIRIGQAFAINKHPVVVEKLKEKRIAVEISPIADQVMSYVGDIRNHPLSLLVATDSPLVIGNFGGSFWNTTGLSYDWYEMFLAMTPRFCDIRCLKQFAVNSWLYSSSTVQEKRRSVLAWEVKWNKFVDYVLGGDYD